MATKFMSLNSLGKGKNKSTIFTHRVLITSIEKTGITPTNWDNVLWLG